MSDQSKQSGYPALTLPHPGLIRVDASETIGTGHVMRCLALATALRQHCPQVIFLLGQCPGPLINRLRGENFALQFLPAEMIEGSAEDAAYTAEYALGLTHADSETTTLPWVIVDGYHFLADYQRLLQGEQEKRLNLLYIDDLHHCQEYTADLVLNQNPAARPAQYPERADQTELLLGPTWTLLRAEFLQYRLEHSPEPPLSKTVKKILLTMGGADSENVTAEVMQALALIFAGPAKSEAAAPEINVTVLIGGGNQHGEAVQQLTDRLNGESGADIFACLTNASNMPTLISDCDLVISAGGTTVWEAAFLHRPTAVLITADNQIAGMTAFAEMGAIVLLQKAKSSLDLPDPKNTTDSKNWLDPKNLADQINAVLDNYEMRRSLVAAASIIDGQGAANVVQAMISKTYK